jgi:hypothetical protein
MTIAKIKKTIAAMNAEIEITRHDVDVTLYEIIAPDGYIWNSGDCQVMMVTRFHFDYSVKEIYEDIFERISCGLSPENSN